MNLLTIACERDKEQLLLLAESVSLFIDECTHYIVINEDNPNINEWENFLSPYYLKNELKLLTYDTSSYLPKWPGGETHIGWHRHAILKILAYKDIKDDYLGLDCKHLFVQRTNPKDFSHYIGCNNFSHYSNLEEKRKPTFEYYKEHFFGQHPNFICHDQMPFLFKRSVLEQIPNLLKTVQWLADMPCMVLEPMFYSFLIIDELEENPHIKGTNRHLGFWRSNNEFIITKPEKIKIIAFHRGFIKNLDEKEYKKINDYLIGLGFKNLLSQKLFKDSKFSHGILPR